MSMSVRVDFYILPNATPEAVLGFACRLLEKAYRHQSLTHVQLESSEQMRALDERLWTFNDISFIPHACDGAIPEAPIQLTAHAQTPLAHHVLLNLTSEILVFYPEFQRVIEVVGGDPTSKEKAREKFRCYRNQGHLLHTHHL